MLNPVILKCYYWPQVTVFKTPFHSVVHQAFHLDLLLVLTKQRMCPRFIRYHEKQTNHVAANGPNLTEISIPITNLPEETKRAVKRSMTLLVSYPRLKTRASCFTEANLLICLTSRGCFSTWACSKPNLRMFMAAL